MSPILQVPSTDGVTVAVHDLGGGADAPPLLLCHATGFCGPVYLPLAATLARRYHVYAVDVRGHGWSTPPANGDFSWDRISTDVLAAVDALGLDRVVAFGHSLGGAMVLFAELGRPGLIEAAYLFEPIVFPVGFSHPGGVNPLGVGAMKRKATFGSRSEVLSRYASRPPLGLLRADCLWHYVEQGFVELPEGGVTLRCAPSSEAGVFNSEDKTTIDRIAPVQSRVTVAMGRRGAEAGPGRLAAAVAETLPHGRLLGYDHLGHFGPLEDPDTVAGDVLAALA